MRARRQKNQINVLCSADNNVITDNKVILAHCKTYFENIYETKRTDRDRNSEQMLDFISSLKPPRLTDIDKLSCEGQITNSECKKALVGMMNNKCPSVSEFSKEFPLHFWPELGDMVVRYVNEAKDKGVLFSTQRRGVITLIPKKGDQRFLKNKRAIC